MKKVFLTLVISIIALAAFSQDDEYKKFLESRKNQMKQKEQSYNNSMNQKNKEYQDFVDKQNAEFAEFVAKKWELFEEFSKDRLELDKPKPSTAPVAEVNTEKQTIKSNEIEYITENKLPEVTHSVAVTYEKKTDNNYEQKMRVEETGVVDLPVKEFSAPKDVVIEKKNNMKLNFYGREIGVSVDPKLRITTAGVDEKDVADYFSKIAKCQNETNVLWGEMKNVVDEFGLNEWGYFCLLRSISEKMFSNINDRVLFCFYMLRNEGGFKTRLARGSKSNNLTLLIALDNSKQVYSYPYFRFDDDTKGGKKVKYYTVYGGGNAKEAVYSYDFCQQDADKKQMSLDFNNVLNMGECDMTRTLELTKDRKVVLPYNKSHIAYLDDVPMTVFPIYFVSSLSIEAQQELMKNFNEMRSQYTPTQFIEVLLHFVQTAFEYKTDEDQFGYEKYFYPEEVIGYPYSDCEDRAALFSWLVQKYTNAKVIGLQYEGHVATAVWFGDDVDITGDGFVYEGKKYYVCDPTYINAGIGMAMPQFKGVTPKVIKLKK